MTRIRRGIMGTGGIAGAMAGTLRAAGSDIVYVATTNDLRHRFLPFLAKVDELIADGAMGDVRHEGLPESPMRSPTDTPDLINRLRT